MPAALIALAVIFYALLYSGIANLKGDPLSTWQALTGATPQGGLAGPNVGLGGDPSAVPPVGAVSGANPVGAAVVAAAQAFIGRPYRLGGTGASGGAIDCSGLVVAAYLAAAHKQLPHSTTQLRAGCVRLARSSLSPGDLIFWLSGSFHHVAIFMGGGQMIESAPSHNGVAIVSVDYQKALGAKTYGRPRFLVGTADPNRPRSGHGR